MNISPKTDKSPLSIHRSGQSPMGLGDQNIPPRRQSDKYSVQFPFMIQTFLAIFSQNKWSQRESWDCFSHLSGLWSGTFILHMLTDLLLLMKRQRDKKGDFSKLAIISMVKLWVLNSTTILFKLIVKKNFIICLSKKKRYTYSKWPVSSNGHPLWKIRMHLTFEKFHGTTSCLVRPKTYG